MVIPAISVLLSSYNHEKYVGKSIESVLNQTFQDFELIIVDDCSPDNSKAVINSYTDPRIRTFFMESNQGMGMTFNYAIKQARGKYLARIDSDDTWTADKLQKQYEYMENHPETGACFSWVKVIDENDREVPAYISDRGQIFAAQNRSQSEWLHQFYSKGCNVCHTSAFIRHEALNNTGIYNYALKQIQDLELWVRIAKQYPLYVICEPLVNYRWFVSTTPNISAATPEVLTRGMFEFFYLMHDFHDGLSDDLFLEAFQNDLLREPATHDEISCERALLMLRQPYLGNSSKIIALIMLNRLLQKDETRSILYNKYDFTIKDYNNICAEKLFYEPQPLPSEIEFYESEITFKNLVKKHLRDRTSIYTLLRRLNHFYKTKIRRSEPR